MNNKALTLSLLMAVMAVFFVQSYVSSIEEDAKKRFGTEVLVIVAKRDVKEMETLNETLLEFKLIPKRFLEPAAISFERKEEDKETAKSLKGLTGQIAVVPVKKGEQITYNKISEPSIRTGLAPQVSPGKRALSISVNDVTGASKLIKPGDRIDLVAILDPGGPKVNRVSRTVLQDIVVLAVGRNVTNNAARIVIDDPFGGKDKIKSLAEDFSYSTITIEVDAIQAQNLVLLQGLDSTLTVSLRNNDDTDKVNLGITTFNDLVGPDAARAPAQRR